MLSAIGHTLKLLESLVIPYFLFRVLSLNNTFTFDEVIYELLITIITYLFTGRKSTLALHIIATLSLTYMCVTKFSFGNKLLSLFYIIKFFHLKNNLS